MERTRILVVDDEVNIRLSMGAILKLHGYEVTLAESVPEALKCISAAPFDVLLSDLHMPGAGDGLTVVSAMRHANPDAVTLLLSAFPEMSAAANAILMQTDEIMIKPMSVPQLLQTISQRLAVGPLQRRIVESVAGIMDRTAQSSIDQWYECVEQEPALMAVPMSRELRCAHLPELFRDLVSRLRSFMPLGTNELRSAAAEEHGVARRQQGYTASMLVKESRLLQVTIFQTLQKNLHHIDFSVLLLGVMTIADEVDSQLSQTVSCFSRETDFENTVA